MSVVNQMLKDLERQQKAPALQLDDDEWIAEKMTDPRQGSRLWVVMSVLSVAALLAGVWFYTRDTEPETLAQNTVSQPLQHGAGQTSAQVAVASDQSALEADGDQTRVNPTSRDRLVGSTPQPATGGQSQDPSAMTDLRLSSQVATERESGTAGTQSALALAQPDQSSGPGESKEPEQQVAMDSPHTRPPATSSSVPVTASQSVAVGSNPLRVKGPVATDGLSSPNRQTSLNNEPVAVKQVSLAQQKASRLSQAQQWIALADYRRAESELKQLLLEFADFHQAREQLVYVYLKTGQTEALKQLLADAIEQFPHHLTYRMVLAQHYANTGDWSSVLALTASDQLTDGSLLFMRALALQQLDQHDQAVEVYVRLLRDDPDRGDWWIGFSFSLEALKRFQDAHQALVRAASDPRLTEQQRHYIQSNQRRLKGLF